MPHRLQLVCLLACGALTAPAYPQDSRPTTTAPAPAAPKPTQPTTPSPPNQQQPTADARATPAAGATDGASAELRKKGWLLDKQGLALQGYDPLSYFDTSGPQRGKVELTSTFRGVTYRFVSAANKERFDHEPLRFEPPYGGWCAFAVIDGDKVEVDPLHYRVIDGRVYLFYKGFFGDAGSKWDALVAKSTAAAIVRKADAGWRELERADQAALDKEAQARAKAKGPAKK